MLSFTITTTTTTTTTCEGVAEREDLPAGGKEFRPRKSVPTEIKSSGGVSR
ncbi:hypothetical protein L195_g063785 [Trifolium pratense]|uniref:Uncharacterized protein n=1 Tax=Trifolium pratense TaxID=57577 RepID=A0A2K3KNY9_TRIPR|nr:hypothetical protein L195_g063785 [Trifolium pratense]